MTFKQLLAMGVAGMFFLGMNGCSNDGPAEKAGKAIDQAAGRTKKKIDELTDR